MKTYSKDKSSPTPLNEKVSEYMRNVKIKNTKPELLFRKALRSHGLIGYRLHRKLLPGKPDVSFGKYKIAVFINGCFWHHCPHCDLSLPKHNTEFWKNKFAKNKERDQRKAKELQDLGWHVLTFWECELKSNMEEKIGELKEVIDKVNLFM